MSNRKSKIILLESVRKGIIPFTALSFETGNYIRVSKTDNYRLMSKDIIYSYQELMKIAESGCFELLTPIFTTGEDHKPFCITICLKHS